MTTWLLRHRASVLLAFVLVTVAGAMSAVQLPVSLFPRIDYPRVVVNLEAEDRPPDRMIIEVTQPVEQALESVPGVTGLRSTSSRGAADLSINFDWGADMGASTLQVESALNRVLPTLTGTVRFDVRRMDPTVFPALGLTLVSDRRDLVALRDLADLQLRPLLAAVPGVAGVEVLGGRQAEYQVLADPARLQAVGLSIEDLATALVANNVVVAIGRIEDRGRQYLALSDSRLRDIDEIGRTLIKTGARGSVQLDDVAQVVAGAAPSWTRVTADGHDAVLLNIRQTPRADVVTMVRAVRARLAERGLHLPADVRIGTYYDQSELVTAAAASVRDAILMGAVLAGAVLLAFLRSWRLTLAVALVLPAVLAAAALVLRMLGMSLNIMTLGGMAAAVGLVVDDAVVMLEYVVRRAHDVPPEDPLTAAAEMVRPLLGSSAATLVVFVPLAFLSGVSGGFFKALAVTIAASLAFSFLFAWCVVPLLVSRLLRRHGAAHEGDAPAWFTAMQDAVGGTLGRQLERPRRLVPVLLGIVVVGTLAWRGLGSGFMPAMDEGGFILDYFARPGTSLSETDRLLRQVEALIVQLPEVDHYSRRTGLQLGGGLSESNEGDFFIHLKPPPRRDIDAVMSDLRARIASQVPGLSVETAQLMEDMIGDLTAVPQPIEVKLFGTDPAALARASAAVAGRLAAIDGLVEVREQGRIAGDAVEVHVDRIKAAHEGLEPEAVTRQLDALVGGRLAGGVQSGDKIVGVRVWSAPDLRERIDQLAALRLRAPDGHDLPVKRIADVRVVPGQSQVTRENLARMIPVTARLEGRDLGSAMRSVRAAIGALALPEGVRVEFGGLYAEQARSLRGLTMVFGSALLLACLLLLYLFERWSIVVSVLATVLLAVAGVFAGLWLTGTDLDISAMMGVTMIVGIVTEVAVFYFAEIDGAATDAAVLVAAARARLRPILMTSLIAALALLPLALGLGKGAGMQRPLAIAIISGLVTALPLILLVMPVLYRSLAGFMAGDGVRRR